MFAFGVSQSHCEQSIPEVLWAYIKLHHCEQDSPECLLVRDNCDASEMPQMHPVYKPEASADKTELVPVEYAPKMPCAPVALKEPWNLHL